MTITIRTESALREDWILRRSVYHNYCKGHLTAIIASGIFLPFLILQLRLPV